MHVMEQQARTTERMDQSSLTELLFTLFRREQFWTLKALQAETKQPTDHLKAVLAEIATQGTRGPYRNKWTLKAHLRQHAARSDDTANQSTSQSQKQ